MILKPIENKIYFISHEEKWVSSEVMCMRYEEQLAHLKKEAILTLRKTTARWFYHEKTDKKMAEAYVKECDYGIENDYYILLEDVDKVLVVRKRKERKRELTAIQKVQYLKKENVPIQPANHFYYAMKYEEGYLDFAYLFLNEKGDVVEKNYLKQRLFS